MVKLPAPPKNRAWILFKAMKTTNMVFLSWGREVVSLTTFASADLNLGISVSFKISFLYLIKLLIVDIIVTRKIKTCQM